MEYLSGTLLYGNDFDLDQIEQWFKEEEEAYSKLEGEQITSDNFAYTNLDKILLVTPAKAFCS